MDPRRRSSLAEPKKHEKKNKGENGHVEKGEAGIAKKTVKKIKGHLVKPVGVEVLAPFHGVSVGIHPRNRKVLNDPLPSLQVETNVGNVDFPGRKSQEKHETSGQGVKPMGSG